MDDSWCHVLFLLSVEEKLTTRQVCHEWKLLFDKSLIYACKGYDLHPCKSVKEFITAYAHSQRTWRQVPSFSPKEITNFQRMKVYPRWVVTACPSFQMVKELNDWDFIKKLGTYQSITSHFVLTQICEEALTRPISVQYVIFSKLVTIGVSPYYLELFMNNKMFCTRLTGRHYLHVIVNERCEYLLKRELKANRKVAIPSDWKRGLEIHAKYNSRRKGK